MWTPKTLYPILPYSKDFRKFNYLKKMHNLKRNDNDQRFDTYGDFKFEFKPYNKIGEICYVSKTM